MASATLADLPERVDTETQHNVLSFKDGSCPPQCVFAFKAVMEMLNLTPIAEDVAFALEMLGYLVEEYNGSYRIDSEAELAAKDIWKRAHAFKGTAANLGLVDLSNTAKAVGSIAGALVLKEDPECKSPRDPDMVFLAEQYDTARLQQELRGVYIGCLNRRIKMVQDWLEEVGKPFGASISEGEAEDGAGE